MQGYYGQKATVRITPGGQVIISSDVRIRLADYYDCPYRAIQICLKTELQASERKVDPPDLLYLVREGYKSLECFC